MDPLPAAEGRVLGCLIEKQLTTPQQYPLTLNALVAACNQASSRDPVTAYAEAEVAGALDALRERRLVRFVLPSHGRSVVRYRHVLDEVLALDAPQLAVLAVLVLRGPQTAGELRARTERMARLDGPGALEHELALLAGREDPLVERASRRPGQKEERWTQCLAAFPAPDRAGRVDSDDQPSGAPVAGVGARGGALGVDDLESVRQELAELREAVASLEEVVADLRQSLGG